MSAQMKLPANHTALHEDEMMYITGGASVETVVKAVVAVGRRSSPPGGGWHSSPGHPERFGRPARPVRRRRGQHRLRQNFIDGALATGQNFLNDLLACKAGLKNANPSSSSHTYTNKAAEHPHRALCLLFVYAVSAVLCPRRSTSDKEKTYPNPSS